MGRQLLAAAWLSALLCSGSVLTTPARADACTGVTCPAKASCAVVETNGPPQCVCPSSVPNLVNSQCSNTALANAAWLNPHNEARVARGLAPLTWSSTLATYAQAWARQLTNCAAITHGDFTLPNGDPMGQNIASVIGTTSASNSSAVEAWLSEFAGYQACTGGCSTADCGHYTQVMWQSTAQVGCGVSSCTYNGKSGLVWVCDYFPAGNSGGLAYQPKGCPPSPPLAPPPPASPPGTASCAGVVCPASSTCTIFSTALGSAPICTCPAGQVLTSAGCSKSGATYTSSVAVYPKTKFYGTPQVVRVIPNGCTPLSLGANGVQSLVFVANVGDKASGATYQTCSGLTFWSTTNCKGAAARYTLPSAPLVPIPSLLNTPITQSGFSVAISC